MKNYINTTGTTTAINGKPAKSTGVKQVAGDKSKNLMHAHRQWATRPADQEVWSIDELLARTGNAKRTSKAVPDVSWGSLRVAAEGEHLGITRGGPLVRFTHWSLRQLCNLPSSDDTGTLAPHHFVAKLSPETAAHVLNERLATGVARTRNAQLLLARDGSKPGHLVPVLRCITTDSYTRVWDYEIAERLAAFARRGTWQPAEAFRTATGTMAHAWGKPKPLPLGWVSDRDMFVVLLDYEGSVEVDGSTYSRFVMLSHSEVGDGALWMMWGLVDGVCSNFIFWGCRNVYEVNLRHSKGITEKWAEIGAQLAAPALTRGDRETLRNGILAARNSVIAEEPDQVKAIVTAATKLPKTLVEDAYNRAVATPRYGKPHSVWAQVNGLTEASQHAASNTDRRVEIDAAAARLMSLVGKL